MRKGNSTVTMQSPSKSAVLIQEFALTKAVPNSPLSVSQNKQSLIRHIQQLTIESPLKAQKDDSVIRPRTAGALQSKSFSSDDKFTNYIKTIRRSRKTSKSQLKKAMKTLERDDVKPPATPNTKDGLRKGNAPDLLFAKEAENEEGYRIVFTKNAKRMMTQRKLTEMKRKIDQVYYEEENAGKVIKYLTNNRLNDSANLMQPKFTSTEVKFSPDLSSLKTNTIEDLINERSSSISNLLTLKSDRIFLKDGHLDMKFKKILEDEKRKKKNKTFQSNLALYLDTKRKEMIAGSLQNNNNTEESPGLAKTEQTTEQEQNDEVSSPQERRGTLQSAMGKKLNRKTIIELRSRTGSVFEDPSRNLPGLDEELDAVKTPVFSSVKQLYVDTNSKEFQPEVYNFYARMDPKSQNFTPRYSKTQFPFANKIQAFSCTVSKRPSLKEINIGEEASPQSQQLSPTRLREKMSKEMSAPPSDREVRHKRRSHSKISEREKFHLKISTVVSKKEAEKKAVDFQTQFYNQKLNSMRNFTSARTPFSALTSPKAESPAETQNFYQDFQKLKGACKQSVRRTASMKKSIKYTFAGLHKKLKQMDNLITDRDVKFEAQILKDIKQGLK